MLQVNSAFNKMKIYLVGGAVRDKLLKQPSPDKDWVVVGASTEQMLQAGYQPVGKDFPVFIHPQTKEEYALARQERKTGRGYTGFEFCTSPSISLEEDLLRRDLTINAMAIDEEGKLIDPYKGLQDLEQRKLRHVSNAFQEDPVRILRVARFAARYHHLGFTIAEETLTLMNSMVLNGEVDHLVPERVWKELVRALAEPSPHVFIESLRACDALKRLMPELDALFGVPQPEQHHPEIDTGIHSLMSLQCATKLSDCTEVRFAALIHDLGKGTTPKDQLPRHIDHEARGVPLIKTLCQRLGAPNQHRDLALLAGEFHTHCHRALELKPATLLKTLKRLDAVRRPERFEQFCLCCKADARGRTGFENHNYPQAEYLRSALQLLQKVDTRIFIRQGLEGAAFGEALHKHRLELLTDLKNRYAKTNE